MLKNQTINFKRRKIKTILNICNLKDSKVKDCSEKANKSLSKIILSKLETDHILQEEGKQRIDFLFSRKRFGSDH